MNITKFLINDIRAFLNRQALIDNINRLKQFESNIFLNKSHSSVFKEKEFNQFLSFLIQSIRRLPFEATA